MLSSEVPEPPQTEAWLCFLIHSLLFLTVWLSGEVARQRWSCGGSVSGPGETGEPGSGLYLTVTVQSEAVINDK